MTNAIARPEKESYLLVEFRFGTDAAATQRYTDWQQDVGPFLSTPLLKTELPDNTGTFGQQEARIDLPLDLFTARISDGRPFSPLYVSVLEHTGGLAAGDAASELVLFRGRVQRAIRNSQGRSNMVSVRALSLKSRLNRALGLQCNHHDEARLFGPASGLSQATFQQTGQIASASGRTVFISTNAAIENPTAPGGTNTRFWEKGFLEVEGLRINVYIWNRLDDPKKFVLRESPPQDWVLAGSNSVLFVPGTHGTIEDARDVWDNEEHFLGLAYASPFYNPIIESPALPLDS